MVSAKYTLNNPDIERQIDEGAATFYCEVTCSATLFRSVVTGQERIQVFKINRNWIRGKVEFLCLVVTKEPVKNYVNIDVHPEMAGIATDLDQGDVLAYLGETDFPADIAFDKLKAASTFMEIVEGDRAYGAFDVILDNPKIFVRLPKKDYAAYTKPEIGQNADLASVFQSSVALPALTFALQQLANGRADDYREKPWARAIEWRMENEFSHSGLTLDSESALNIAQLLLGSPVERLLTSLCQKLWN